MKARPILMHARSIENLLAGRKVQTRRIVKPQPPDAVTAVDPHRDFQNEWVPWRDGVASESIVCPYGAPGDLLYVREAWRAPSTFDREPGSAFRGVKVWYEADDGYKGAGRYRHARFMPRWASRLALRLTDVRVDRVKTISHADIVAEGWQSKNLGAEIDRDAASDWWGEMWVDTNGRDSWSANPWVWALTFEVWKINVDDMILALDAHETGCKPFRAAPIARPACDHEEGSDGRCIHCGADKPCEDCGGRGCEQCNGVHVP